MRMSWEQYEPAAHEAEDGFTGRLQLKNQGMGTGLSRSNGELMMEESTGACL